MLIREVLHVNLTVQSQLEMSSRIIMNNARLLVSTQHSPEKKNFISFHVLVFSHRARLILWLAAKADWLHNHAT